MQAPRKLTAGASKESKRVIKSLFHRHIEPLLKDNTDIYSLVNIWEERGLSTASIRKLITIWRAHIEETGNTPPSTKSLSKRLTARKEASIAKTWSKEECRRAISAAWHLDRELHDALVLTLHTGMRGGELLGLQWRDVDLIAGKLLIRRTKTGKPRALRMTASMEAVINNRYIVGETPANSYVMNRRDLRGPLRRLCEQIDLPRLRWHDLRHTVATILLNDGANLKAVAEQLGHSSPVTTAKTYWHLVEGQELQLQSLLC